SQAKVNAQIALREIAAAAAHLVNETQLTLPILCLDGATQARSDAAAIGSDADGPHFDPVVMVPHITTDQLWRAIDGADQNIQIAIVVEVAKSAPAGCGWSLDSRAALQRNIFKFSVAQVAIQQLALRVAGFGGQLLDLGIDVA